MDVLDTLLPPEMARKAEDVGVAKATMARGPQFGLAVLAGAFIGLGGIFSTVAITGAGDVLPYGLVRVLAGTTFCLGLVLVVVGGAELFTGNSLIVMAWASRRVRTRQMLSGWAWVYVGNFVGGLGTAMLVVLAQHHELAGGAVGAQQWAIARTKLGHGFGQAVVLGILCNALVCLAVWMTLSTRSTAGRIAAIVFPVTAFVTAGFEHCVASMYFIPVALMLKALDGGWVQRAGLDPGEITWSAFLTDNLLPVTLGNVIGGVVLVAAVYWLVYLRPRAQGAA